MCTITFDETRGCEVAVYNNMDKAMHALARQLHEESVNNGEALDTDWGIPGYIDTMKREAKHILENYGESEMPHVDGHRIIKFEKE